MKRIFDDTLEKPVGPYSPAVQVGEWLFISSQMGTENSKMREGVRSQTIQALKNIEKILFSAGTDKKSLVKLNVFLKDISYFEEMNEAYKSFFDAEYPARSTFAVHGLPWNALVEIEATAFIKGGGR